MKHEICFHLLGYCQADTPKSFLMFLSKRIIGSSCIWKVPGVHFRIFFLSLNVMPKITRPFVYKCNDKIAIRNVKFLYFSRYNVFFF